MPISMLKGREVEVSLSLLNQILGVFDEGDLITLKKGDLSIEEYNSAKWIHLISGGKSKTTLKGDMLSRNRKVLLYIYYFSKIRRFEQCQWI